MPQQLFLPGLGAPILDRLFFALFPDAPAAAQAWEIGAGLRDKNGLKGRPHPARRLHVSLHWLGDYPGLPSAVVTAAVAAAASLREGPFDICLDRIGSFMGRRPPLVLRGGNAIIPLIAFQHALGVAMTRQGLGRWLAPRYTPHMTLLYDRRYLEPRPVTPVAWTARDFVLVHSHIGRSQYDILGRWPLHSPS